MSDEQKGHRERVKKRFLRDGLAGFDDDNVLELLLFYALPRVDTKQLARRLLARFGRLDRVFSATPQELMQVDGVGENAAILIHLVAEANGRSQRARTSGSCVLATSEDVGNFLVPYFLGEEEEKVYMVTLDHECRLISCHCMQTGDQGSVPVDVRKIVKHALSDGASAVVLAHNHVEGFALPSEDDISTTYCVRDALSLVGVDMLDHLIVGDGDFVSLAESRMIQ